MNRELKFRVWDIEKQHYLIPDKDEHQYFAPDGDRWQVTVPLSECLRDTKRYVVEQYTGLKDIQGREVYEGDIVRWYEYGNPFEGERDSSGEYTVLWNKDALRLDFHEHNDGQWYLLADTNFDIVTDNMLEREKRNKNAGAVRCDYCGRFVKKEELAVIYTPDTEFTTEQSDIVCRRCK